MALATNGSVGTIHLYGDFIDNRDAYNPQLKPTGATPGIYVLPDLVVDSKGRVVHAQSGSAGSSSAKGLVQFGTNITDEGSGVFGVVAAEDATFGVTKSANTDHITITAGAINVGPDVIGETDTATASAFGVAQFGTNITDEGSGVFGVVAASGSTTLGVAKSADTGHITIIAGDIDVGVGVLVTDAPSTFTAGLHLTMETITSVSSVFTPDLSISSLFLVDMTEDATLATPSGAVVGDKFNIIVKSNGWELTLDTDFKNRSTPATPAGDAIITCQMVATGKFFTTIQSNFV